MSTSLQVDSPAAIPRLSKSRFLSGKQCHRRLWLECYRRDLAASPDEMTRAVLASGARVGELARRRFPGGIQIVDDHLRHGEAVAATRDALADPAVPAIYEAAFTADDVRIRADVLVRRPDGSWDLVEVKASTGVKPEHPWDLAIQLHVLETAGVRIARTLLMHLDSGYVHPGGDWDLRALFRAVDLTAGVRALGAEVRAQLAAMREPLSLRREPVRAIGPHCHAPWECPFLAHCGKDEPDHPVRKLPRISWELVERLADDGVTDAREVPDDYPGLSLAQRRACETLRTGIRFHDPAVREPLRGLGLPVYFFDFETFMPALPAFPGTRPYQTISFQWSAHVLREDGSVAHLSYLHDRPDDPRRAVATSLLDALGERGAVVAWSGYEEFVLSALEEALPDLAPRLARVRERIFDLLPVVRRHVYDPAFAGSFSLKAVAPALLPHLTYDGLTIREGGSASLAYGELRDPATAPDRAAEIREALLAYCGRDTEILLELYRLLSAADNH